jgi:hypothetical protein
MHAQRRQPSLVRVANHWRSQFPRADVQGLRPFDGDHVAGELPPKAPTTGSLAPRDQDAFVL